MQKGMLKFDKSRTRYGWLSSNFIFRAHLDGWSGYFCGRMWEGLFNSNEVWQERKSGGDVSQISANPCKMDAFANCAPSHEPRTRICPDSSLRTRAPAARRANIVHEQFKLFTGLKMKWDLSWILFVGAPPPDKFDARRPCQIVQIPRFDFGSMCEFLKALVDVQSIAYRTIMIDRAFFFYFRHTCTLIES